MAAAATVYREAERHAEGFMKAAILNKLGMLAYNVGDLPGARERYEEALAVKPDEYAIHMNLGNALHDLGEHDAARRAYDQALALNRLPDVLLNLAVFLAERDPRAALGLIRECLQSPDALEKAGIPVEVPLHMLVDLGEHAELRAEVLRTIDEAAARTWESTEPWTFTNQRAILLSRIGRSDEALRAFEGIRKEWPAATDVCFNLGMALVRLERWDDARAEFSKVDHPLRHYGLGLNFERTGHPEDAAREYREFLERLAEEPMDELSVRGVDPERRYRKYVGQARDFLATHPA